MMGLSGTEFTKVLEDKLNAAFQPESLVVTNESHLHAGHAGSPGTGTSHFHICIVSDKFEGQNRLARQRAINDVLKVEISEVIHALSLEVLTPEQAN
jgi:BolA protein